MSWKIPKVQMSLALGLIFLSALIAHPTLNILTHGLLAILTALITDFIFWKIRKISAFVPSAGLVTGLILALLISPDLPWYVIVVTSFIAIFFKNFVRVGDRHIFNPAASGLFLSGTIFQTNISWWAVSFQAFNVDLRSLIFFLILLSPAAVSFVKMKRYRIIALFSIFYGLILLAKGRLNINTDTLKLAFVDPTVLFFALVMLPEPKTSPNDFKFQYIFGVFVAILAFVLSLPFLNNLPILIIHDPLILALLIGNLIFFNK